MYVNRTLTHTERHSETFLKVQENKGINWKNTLFVALVLVLLLLISLSDVAFLAFSFMANTARN